MPISYSLDHEQRLVRVRWFGEVTADDYAAHVRRLMADADALAYHRSVADLREANFMIAGSALFKAFREGAVSALGDDRWQTAVVVGSDFQYGAARQFQMFLESIADVGIFRDEAEALAWLLALP